MSINCILIDDERSARNNLANLLQRHFPDITILAKATNLMEGVEKIKQLQPEIVFLDVEMPQYSGYEIIDFFDRIDFQIIFVTAYDKYAINAFEVNAVDYVLKPIHSSKLIDAVNKAKLKLHDQELLCNYEKIIQEFKTGIPKTILITDNNYKQNIVIENIIAIEAQRSYANIHLNDNRKILVSKNIGYFEEELKTEQLFFRSHKSWLINIKYIINYSKTKLIVNLKGDISAKLSRYKTVQIDGVLYSS
ncbi:MAG: LytTR family DNA-binding domain-containing protein [Flavobacteriales bacterium]|jgi:two-component system LytT family response regulator|nr:LytTR family DNA-binding domain-containing protein [Flavobacteriales bacterium]